MRTACFGHCTLCMASLTSGAKRRPTLSFHSRQFQNRIFVCLQVVIVCSGLRATSAFCVDFLGMQMWQEYFVVTASERPETGCIRFGRLSCEAYRHHNMLDFYHLVRPWRVWLPQQPTVELCVVPIRAVRIFELCIIVCILATSCA